MLARELGHHQHRRQHRQRRIVVQPARGLDAVQVRHVPVHQHHLMRIVAQQLQRGRAGIDRARYEAETAQQLFQHGARGRAVVDDQDLLADRLGRRATQGGGGRLRLQRDREIETAAGAGRAVDGDDAAHGLHQLLRNGQPQAGAAVQAGGAGVGLGKGVEQSGLLGQADADARIFHRELQPQWLAAGCQRDGALIRAVPLALIAGPLDAQENKTAIWPSVSVRSKGTASSSSLPDSMREKSSTSLMMPSRFWPARPILWKKSRGCGATSRCAPRPAKPMMAFIGVRISWLILARKSLLARVEASASARACWMARIASAFWKADTNGSRSAMNRSSSAFAIGAPCSNTR